jgi:hypothetical protein
MRFLASCLELRLKVLVPLQVLFLSVRGRLFVASEVFLQSRDRGLVLPKSIMLQRMRSVDDDTVLRTAHQSLTLHFCVAGQNVLFVQPSDMFDVFSINPKFEVQLVAK